MHAQLPPFDGNGILPEGEYDLTIDALRTSYLVTGAGLGSHWDARWRAKLVDNLGILVGQLVRVGIRDIFIGGSFVEEKDHPNDIDGYFMCTARELYSGELERSLNKLDPHASWTWDQAKARPYRGSRKKKLAMWHRYRVELYPHWGNDSEFPADFIRRSRSGKPRGIIKIRGEP
jgi:hypothetical protein